MERYGRYEVDPNEMVIATRLVWRVVAHACDESGHTALAALIRDDTMLAEQHVPLPISLPPADAALVRRYIANLALTRVEAAV